MNEELAAFRRAFRKLLEDHGASIEAECDDCSDLHGVTGEHMVVNRRPGLSDCTLG